MNENNQRNENSSKAERIRAIRAAIDAQNAAAPSVGDTQEFVSPKPERRPPQPPPPHGEGNRKKGRKGKKKKKKKPLSRRLRELFPEKGDRPAEVVRKISFLVSVIAVCVCSYMIGDYYLDLWRNSVRNKELSGIYNMYPPIYTTMPEDEQSNWFEKEYYILDAAQKLLDKNPDVIGYMSIPTKGGDPVIELPVVQAEDNDKYLHLSVLGDESRAGTLFLDYRNFFDHVVDHKLVDKNSDNLVVYGHNMKDDSMFGALRYYEQKEDYYQNHPLIQFNSNYEMYTYKIFAFFIVDAYDETDTKFACWNKLNFEDEYEFYDFVNEAKKRTIRNTDVDVKYGDQILTLSTCNYVLDDRSRFIVMARKVRPGEDMYEGTERSIKNTNVKYPTLYYSVRPYEHYNEDALFMPYGPEDAVKEAEKAFAEAKKQAEEQKKKAEEEKKKAEADKKKS